MRLEASLESLLSIIELIAIRRHQGLLSITRNQDGWTVTMGDGNDGDALAGETLSEALENAIVPVNPKKIDYKNWSPGKPQGALFRKE